MDVRLKRAYDPAEPADGHRVLIDRLWPRGVSRDRAKLDDWEKELSPSTELRQWFAHEPERFDLQEEVAGPLVLKSVLLGDAEHNDAVVLAEVLRRGMPRA